MPVKPAAASVWQLAQVDSNTDMPAFTETPALEPPPLVVVPVEPLVDVPVEPLVDVPVDPLVDVPAEPPSGPVDPLVEAFVAVLPPDDAEDDVPDSEYATISAFWPAPLGKLAAVTSMFPSIASAELVPAASCCDQTILPVLRFIAISLPLNVVVNTRSFVTVADP